MTHFVFLVLMVRFFAESRKQILCGVISKQQSAAEGEDGVGEKILDPDADMGRVNCGIAAQEILNALSEMVLNFPLIVPFGLRDAPFQDNSGGALPHPVPRPECSLTDLKECPESWLHYPHRYTCKTAQSVYVPSHFLFRNFPFSVCEAFLWLCESSLWPGFDGLCVRL